MKIWQDTLRTLGVIGLTMCLAACGGGGDGGITNDDPGDNNIYVVAAFGDSITQGSECSCTPYPARLAGMIGRTVPNYGAGGTTAEDNVWRTQSVIDSCHPGFMLILYGVNDIIHGHGIDSIIGALSQMIGICKNNKVVPVIATYPDMIYSHLIFNPRLQQLNEQIRLLAQSQNIRLVDLQKEFGADPDLYEKDGLHPNDAGTQVIAMAFADLFDVSDVPPSASSSGETN